MSTPRVPVPGADLAGDVVLPPAARHYLAVRRVAAGQAVVLFDGRGHEVDAVVVELPDGLIARPTGPIRQGAESPVVQLWYGLPKGDKLDAVIRDVTELGVDRVCLLACRRSVVQLEGPRLKQRMERLQRIAEEAARQSGRTRVPTLEPPCTVVEALARRAALTGGVEAGCLLVLQPTATATLHAVDLVAPVGVCVGPEGGFAPEELAAFEAAGALSVRLQGPILRTETAAPIACALVLHGLGGL